MPHNGTGVIWYRFFMAESRRHGGRLTGAGVPEGTRVSIAMNISLVVDLYEELQLLWGDSIESKKVEIIP